MKSRVIRPGAAGAARGHERRGRAAGNDGSARPVLDPQGAVLPGVTVIVRNQDNGMFREAISAAEGIYFISGLVPGVYEITAELQGFKKYARRDVRLEIGKTATVDVPLQVGSVAETITVTAEAPLVDVTSKEVGGNIGSNELIELPSINRNFIGFIGLLPGIVPSISTESFGSDSVSVNGSDPRNNNYLLDGGNNNDDVIGQRAGTQARTALESVQEFQVITNQFDAQFGRTTGAIINAVTKSGTNRFRGSAFAFAQDAAWTDKGLLRRELRRRAEPQEARHQAPGVRRHDRRADHPGPDALLRQPRARHDRSRRRRRLPEPPGPELEPDDAGPRVEHAGARRQPVQREPYLGRPLPA